MALARRGLVFFATLALCAVLAGCTGTTGPSLFGKGAAEPAGQCYWLSNEGQGWIARPDLAQPSACYEMDSCSGGLGMSGGGCYKWALGKDAPARAWREITPVSSAISSPAPGRAQCYSMIDYPNTWQPRPDIETAKACFDMDSCAGGLRRSAGNCYKWAESIDAPGQEWAALGFKWPSRDVDHPGPPLENGFYIFPGCQGEGGCNMSNWRAREATPLLAEPRVGARVVATLRANEFVRATTVITRIIPSRGVVTAADESYGERFKVGDVVFALGYLGEGEQEIWNKSIGLSDGLTQEDTVQIAWDPGTPYTPAQAAMAGLWAELTRENGQKGWVHQPEFDCMGSLAGDVGCRE